MSVTKVLEAGLSFTGAFSGVLQTNANFVDQVIFGPAVDGVAWNGAWSKTQVAAKKVALRDLPPTAQSHLAGLNNTDDMAAYDPMR